MMKSMCVVAAYVDGSKIDIPHDIHEEHDLLDEIYELYTDYILIVYKYDDTTDVQIITTENEYYFSNRSTVVNGICKPYLHDYYRHNYYDDFRINPNNFTYVLKLAKCYQDSKGDMNLVDRLMGRGTKSAKK